MGDQDMKIIRVAILSSAVFVAAGVHTWAGTFDAHIDVDEERTLMDSEGVSADFPDSGDDRISTGDDRIPAGDDKIPTGDDLWSRAADVLDGLVTKSREKIRERMDEAQFEKPSTAHSRTPDEAEEPKILSTADYDYTIDEDSKTITIVKYKGNQKRVAIPSKIGDHSVSGIGSEAFRYQKLKSVDFPETVQTIGKRAFEYCTISDTLLLPENAVILDEVFAYAKLPASLTVPAGAVVGKCTFSYCEDLQNVFIEPGAVIKSRGFEYCNDLKLVICANGCRLEKGAFGYCRKLGKVILCGGVEAEAGAFDNCGDHEKTAAEADEFDTLKKSAMDGSLTGEKDDAPEEGVERTLEIRNSPVSKDGVTVTLDTATAKGDKTGFEYTFSGTIENTSDEGIMQVIYTFALIDENGEEFRSFGEVYDGEDTALSPHEKTGFFHDGVKWGKQSVPAAVAIDISSVKTEAELPPAHIPQKGEYLYQALGDEKLARIKEEPPVELSFHVDQGGYGRTATFTEGEGLDRAVELFCGIQIGDESGEWVTDNYNGIYITWKDGSYSGISINLHNLERSIHSRIHTYELEHLDEFWSYAAGYLTEDR